MVVNSDTPATQHVFDMLDVRAGLRDAIRSLRRSEDFTAMLRRLLEQMSQAAPVGRKKVTLLLDLFRVRHRRLLRGIMCCDRVRAEVVCVQDIRASIILRPTHDHCDRTGRRYNYDALQPGL